MISRKNTDKTCDKCGSIIFNVSIKTPFLDDFETSCSSIDCKGFTDPVRILNNREAQIAIADANYESTGEDNL